jgi:hypothetical protein
VLAAAAIQYALYATVLRPALAADDVERRREGLVRWTALMLVLETLVAAAAGVYVLALLQRHPGGWAWVAPALGLVVGSALPLQLVVGRIMRSVLR